MLICRADNVYISERLAAIPWLIHGFGTRLSPNWPGEYTRVGQVHSDIVVRADDGELPPRGDALMTHTPGRLVGVRTADCVPVLLVDPANRAVAAVHAGWRGTAQRIVSKAVGAMQEAYGSQPEGLLAVIGPCIGECCYEVGPEVLDALGESGRDWHVDLAAVNRRQLTEAGVPEGSVEVSGLCTKCMPDLESYRRDGEVSGRMVAAIGIR